jgi:formamidopyrimidine-DNA glycosylase
MPELPEAETIRRQLEKEVAGATIGKLEVLISRAAREHASVRELARLVEGKKIARVGRRGKALLLFLEGNGGRGHPSTSSGQAARPTSLIIRLGMTGLIQVTPKKEPVPEHTAAVLHLRDGRQIRFVDQRQFGLVTARQGHDVDAMPEFQEYGPEPFSEQFTLEYLKQAFARRGAVLESVLMDQHVIAGIGKIYADEICFRAGIRPTRGARRLTGPMRERLWKAVREVLAEAVNCRGSSAADETYRDVYGMPGRFQERMRVYQRTGQPCLVCGTPIKRTAMPGGRGMHWCPKCQL